MKRIKIAADFSDTPFGRYPDDSDVNGTKFRDEILVPALRSGGEVVVDIGDVEGFGSSFLEEAFGGLVRMGYFTGAELHERLKIACDDESNLHYVNVIWKHIDDEDSVRK